MQSAVTERFMQCLHKLIEDNQVKSMRQFAISLDYLPQGLSEISNGRRDVTIELLRKAIEKYQFNSDFIFTGQGTRFKNEQRSDLKILSIVTDRDNKEYIVHVPVAAQAGYTDQFMEPDYIRELPTYNLPYDNVRGESYRSFDVAGASMEPTLQHGDKVVCSFIEPQYWQQAIRDGQVYVVITSDGVVVKRIINRIRTHRCVDLVSDNTTYDVAELPAEEIREIWWVRLRITPYMDRPAGQSTDLHKAIEHLSSQVSRLVG